MDSLIELFTHSYTGSNPSYDTVHSLISILSLSLSLTHTHTHTYSRSLSLSLLLVYS